MENEELGQVRTVTIGEDAWFVTKDVCDVLDMKNTTMAIQKLDSDEVTKFNLGRQWNYSCVAKHYRG
ncbi:Bro-N domain-containing protein [Bacillus nitratireducens]|uniref:BRO-N domain-containing protein n=1 Tax=Bacillus nitratireducens TaxID=2026193 RepID=UPI00399D4725